MILNDHGTSNDFRMINVTKSDLIASSMSVIGCHWKKMKCGLLFE